jgi:hypothetical protein
LANKKVVSEDKFLDDNKSVKEQILSILKEVDDAEHETASIPDKVTHLFAKNQYQSKNTAPVQFPTEIIFRQITFGLACMIFAIFILVIGFFYLPKNDQLPFISASLIVLLVGAWQIDKGNKEYIKNCRDKL